MGKTRQQKRELNPRMWFMLPDDGKGANIQQVWHKVTKKEFMEEWRKNGLFEEVISTYISGDLCLYIRVEDQFKNREQFKATAPPRPKGGGIRARSGKKSQEPHAEDQPSKDVGRDA